MDEGFCFHKCRREVHDRNLYEHWIDTYCRDCKEQVIEYEGVWIPRALPNHALLVRAYRDRLVRQVDDELMRLTHSRIV